MNARDRVFEPERKENIACALKVHRELGPGFLETVYHQAIAVNLSTRKIPFERERGVQDLFRGVEVGFHRLDLVVRNMIVVEIKSVVDLAPSHFAQLRAYLRATGLETGLLLNFNNPTLQVRRVVNTRQYSGAKPILI